VFTDTPGPDQIEACQEYVRDWAEYVSSVVVHGGAVAVANTLYEHREFMPTRFERRGFEEGWVSDVSLFNIVASRETEDYDYGLDFDFVNVYYDVFMPSYFLLHHISRTSVDGLRSVLRAMGEQGHVLSSDHEVGAAVLTLGAADVREYVRGLMQVPIPTLYEKCSPLFINEMPYSFDICMFVNAASHVMSDEEVADAMMWIAQYYIQDDTYTDDATRIRILKSYVFPFITLCMGGGGGDGGVPRPDGGKRSKDAIRQMLLQPVDTHDFMQAALDGWV
jgi:hypothetical protein